MRRRSSARGTPTAHGRALDVRDLDTDAVAYRVGVVNAASVATANEAPGYDRPFRVTAWELRMAPPEHELATWGGYRSAGRLARTTGVRPPRWMERAACEISVRGIVHLPTACAVAEWHRTHPRAPLADSGIPWKDRCPQVPDGYTVPGTVLPGPRAPRRAAPRHPLAVRLLAAMEAA